MCYGEDIPPLDFSGLHVACLSGENGAGKSALLDAMTWALWGKSRAHRDDDLVHQGSVEMEVEFEFALGENRYRVIRKRDTRRGGKSVLELQVWDNERFRPLTEPTIRQTQAAIQRLLRLDYDTFINSAFLRQGRADEFTVQPPAERKRILGEILGLSLYDELEERAKQRVRAKEQEGREIEAQIREFDRELANRPTYQAELQAAEAEVARLSAELLTAEATRQARQAEVQSLEHQQRQLQDLRRRLDQARREIMEVEEQTNRHRSLVAAYREILLQRQRIEADFTALTTARAAEAEFSRKLSRLVSLTKRHSELEGAIAAAQNVLKTELQLAVQRRMDLQQRIQGQVQWRQELEDVRCKLAQLNELQTAQDRWRMEREALLSEQAGLSAQNEQLKAEMSSLKDKVALLQGATARCPLCGSELDLASRDRLVEQFTVEGKARGDRYRANRTRLQQIASQIQELERSLASAESQLAARSVLQKREATLERALAEAWQAQESLTKVEEQIQSVQTRLQSSEYALEEQAALEVLKQEIAALGYDQTEHEKWRAEVERLSNAEEPYNRLQIARAAIDEEEAELKRLEDRRRRWAETLAADLEQEQVLQKAVAQLPQALEALRLAEAEREQVEVALGQARDKMAVARQKLAYCDYLAREREKKATQALQVAEERAVYEELALAFGKKGVQAMIIEAVLPEIEDEANRLLRRMTDGRMHVRLETQRETKTGEAVETLDIHISDELGSRPYEMYSGGESFRINFALRIALSKLLARRAGARLQTLVIDEGFGTQDARGRERLVEAINVIRDDFARILVITHIEELKDAFPARIEVVKTPTGSRVHIT